MRQVDFISLSNASATGAAKSLSGGLYEFAAVATWSAGNVAIQKLMPDGTTWLGVGTALSATGVNTVNLAPGEYRLAVTTSTAVYATLTRIPGE